jgi:hypothetical protein
VQTGGATPLFIACQNGHVAVVTALLDRGASHAQATVCCVALVIGSLAYALVVMCLLCDHDEYHVRMLKHTAYAMDDPFVAPLAD